MGKTTELLALEAFGNAAARVPAYKTILREAGIQPRDIRTPVDFARLPILEKRATFQRFGIDQLCLDGQLGPLATVLTSSGHSGIFSFGLTRADADESTTRWVDDTLHTLFTVRAKRTLLINCLPMGVKI